MSETKFTKGPWKAHLNVPTATIPGHIIKADHGVGRPIASLCEGGGSKGKPEQIANAYLIAAAPEMYEALEKLLEDIHDIRMMRSEYGGVVPQSDTECDAISLLAKARGEEVT